MRCIVPCKVTINIYPGFAAYVHLAYLCRRCAAEGMPEDSEQCEIKAMGLNGVVALEELLSDEAVLLVGELRPLGRKIGCDLGSGLTQSRIPGPDDQLSLQTGMGSERIVSRLVGPIVLSPADCVGAGRWGSMSDWWRRISTKVTPAMLMSTSKISKIRRILTPLFIHGRTTKRESIPSLSDTVVIEQHTIDVPARSCACVQDSRC
jgi:hypothetical protein